MSQKRKRSPDQDITDSDPVFRSEAREDRSSTFIGLYSPSLKPKDLQSLDEIASASHKILGWRRESNQQSITGSTNYVTGSDDDGEKYGGKRIEKILDGMKVTGACVVARWYGGILLGPVRFEHIEKCAQEAVQKWKDSIAEEQFKKRKEESDQKEKANLVRVLAERDQSIEVLRKLAAEKEESVKHARLEREADKGEDGQTQSNEHSSEKVELAISPKSQPSNNYAGMTLERLKALEKSRDATLSFLLKRIDKAEVELVGVTGEIPNK